MSLPLIGQPSPVLLNNPSFEDIPNHSQPPSGWYFCGPIGESPPDVHPNGFFKVEHEAFHGHTFVGMVTRDNGSWECLGQQLETPLVAGQCYQFTIHLAQSQTYESISRGTMDFALFTTPVVLRIWGGNQNCQKDELLAQTKTVAHEDWKGYSFLFQPSLSYSHFFLEAYFEKEHTKAYNGNLLLDQAGPLLPVDCNNHMPLSEIKSLNLSSPPTQEALSRFIAEKGSRIKFTHSGLQLEQHLFKDQAGKTQQSNCYLWGIAKALRQFPQIKLTIAIRSNSEFELTERRFHLATALEQAGLPASQYKLKTFHHPPHGKDWLWEMGEESEIGMKVR